MFTKTNKNDPLVESIKNVMEHNDILRRVETAVNEHFGVVSKKALPHEYHAEYDAIFEETKRCAMEEESHNKKDEDKKSSPATPEHHRAEAIRIHKAIKSGGRMPHLVAKKKEHEDAYKRMTGKKIEYPKDLDEAKDEGSTPRNAKERALAKLHGDPNKITHGDVLKGRGVVEEEKATESQKEKVAKVMHKWKQGKEHIGKSEKTVPMTKKGQKQAVAIALSQAGLSKKDKMNEDIESILEEIRTNLEERLVAVYESGDESAFTNFVGSLTEEQLEILGLMEAGETNVYGKSRDAPSIPLKNVDNKPSIEPLAKPAATAPTSSSSSTPLTTGQGNRTSNVVTPLKGGSTSAGNLGPVTSKSGPLSGAQQKRPVPAAPQGPSVSPQGRTGALGTPSQTNSLLPKGYDVGKSKPSGPVTKPGGKTTPNIPQQSVQRPGAVSKPGTSSVRPIQRQATRPGMSQRPGMSRPTSRQMVRRPETTGDIMNRAIGIREETESPKPIKESFEQFLRNKFLKG
jgi:hypothetical protein